MQEIREKPEQNIRTRIAFLIEKCGVGATDEILSLTLSRGGGKCDNCFGHKTVYAGKIDKLDSGWRDCPKCEGTGQLPV